MSRRHSLALVAALFVLMVGGFIAGKALASTGLFQGQLGDSHLPRAHGPGAPATSGNGPVAGTDAPEPPPSGQPDPSGRPGDQNNPGDSSDKLLYWIDVDVTTQKVRVMQGDEVIKEMLASTGVEGHETPLGTFEIQNRGTWFFSEKYQQGARYWVSFKDWGIYLFHSLAMDKDQKIIEEEAAKLGEPASHGCVRLPVDDARWIYDNIPQKTKVVIHE